MSNRRDLSPQDMAQNSVLKGLVVVARTSVAGILQRQKGRRRFVSAFYALFVYFYLHLTRIPRIERQPIPERSDRSNCLANRDY